MKARAADGQEHRLYSAGRLRLDTWKVPPDVVPMLWVYPRPGQRALQLTVWRRKIEVRWRQR